MPSSHFKMPPFPVYTYEDRPPDVKIHTNAGSIGLVQGSAMSQAFKTSNQTVSPSIGSHRQ